MKRTIIAGSAALALALPLIAGCSSSPSQDQLSQLQQIQAEDQSLEAKIASLQKEKETLQTSIAASDGKLSQCRSERASVDAKIKAAQTQNQEKEENK